MSNVRPEPAPTTWMIDEHSTFLSMSPTLAFWTLRILPRIGSSAWNSESRADLAVPSAESPSTMNSSLRSTSADRQSASLAGSALDSSAFLRRWVSRCCRAMMRVRLALDDLLHDEPGLGLLRRLGGRQERLELAGDHLVDQAGDRRGAEHLLRLALELRLGETHGDDGGHALQDVVLDDVVVGLLELAAGAQHLVERLGEAPLEPLHVRAALGRRDDVDERAHLGVVAGAPSQGDVDREVAGDLLRRHVALVVEQRHGLGERVLALQPHDVGDRLVGGQELAELGDAAVVAERLGLDLLTALVADDELETGHEERGLTGAHDQLVVAVRGALDEDLGVGPVADARAADALLDLAELAQLVAGDEVGGVAVTGELPWRAAAERHRPGGAVLVDLDVEARGQRVDDGGAHAVQPAGGDVGAAAELAAGVQLGEHDLDAGQAGLLLRRRPGCPGRRR